MLSLMEAGGVAFLFSLFMTPVFRRFLRQRSFGLRVREDGPITHRSKEGTPTMGGVVIVAAALIGYAMGHVGTAITFTRAGVLVAGGTFAGVPPVSDEELHAATAARPSSMGKRNVSFAAWLADSETR